MHPTEPNAVRTVLRNENFLSSRNHGPILDAAHALSNVDFFDGRATYKAGGTSNDF